MLNIISYTAKKKKKKRPPGKTINPITSKETTTITVRKTPVAVIDESKPAVMVVRYSSAVIATFEKLASCPTLRVLHACALERAWRAA